MEHKDTYNEHKNEVIDLNGMEIIGTKSVTCNEDASQVIVTP